MIASELATDDPFDELEDRTPWSFSDGPRLNLLSAFPLSRLVPIGQIVPLRFDKRMTTRATLDSRRLLLCSACSPSSFQQAVLGQDFEPGHLASTSLNRRHSASEEPST